MTTSAKHFFRYRFPAIIWAAVIFAASSIPGHRLPKFVLMINDKVIHASVYFVFGLLVYRALEPKVPTVTFDWRRLIIAVTTVVLYGITDEIHQSFVPGRTVDVKDATADAVGGAISGLVVFLDSIRRRRRT